MMVDKARENQRETDTDRYELQRSIQASRRSGQRQARARSPSPKTAYPSAFSQRRPLSRINQTFGPDRTEPFKRHFHAARSRDAAAVRRHRPAFRRPRYFPALGLAASRFRGSARAMADR